MVRALLVLGVVAGCTQWRQRELALQAVFVGEGLVDWRQTNDITARCQEENPLLRACGTGTPTYLYFPLVYLFHLAVAELLPSGVVRTIFLATSVTLEGRTVVDNARNGY